jgi:SlyX protein
MCPNFAPSNCRHASTAMSTERLTQLEEKLAYQEHSIAELNDVIYRQQQELDALKEHQQELDERIRSLQESGPGAEGEEAPPHY